MQRLLIISHTPHYRREDQIVGWGPTVREIDHLSRLFGEVIHLAPLYENSAPASALPYRSSRVQLRPVPPTGGERLQDKLQILRCWPTYLRAMQKELALADAVHVRCPANISLLALMLLAFRPMSRIRWVKYAGNWRPQGGDHASYALQRWWLKGNFHRGSVTINGHWPNQGKHVVSFFNPSLSSEDVYIGGKAGYQKRLGQPVKLLYVGRVESEKGAGRAVRIAELLQLQGIEMKLHVIGDGSQLEKLRQLVKDSSDSSGGEIVFHGWLPWSALADFYAGSHFILLPSVAAEGWPKVLSEAMAYGVVPLAGAISSIPQLLQAFRAGIALPPHDVAAFVQAIKFFVENPAHWESASKAGLEAAPNFTFSNYLNAVQDMFERVWGVHLRQQASPIVHR